MQKSLSMGIELQTANEDLFLKLVHKNQGIIHKICCLYCKNDEDKRDMYQEITIQLWKAFPSFENRSKFSTWMYRVALNAAITITRKNNRRPKTDELTDYSKTVDHCENFAFFDEEIKLLYRAINQLNKIDRAIIMLYLDKKSYEEIAEIIGITKTNVSVKIHRIKSKLEKIYNKINV